MSVAGGTPIDMSLLQTAQAQQTASKARDKERASTDRAQRFRDQVELRVAGVEGAEAPRQLPQNDSEQAEAEHRSEDHRLPPDEGDDSGHVDVTA
jgi:hypothetical protein